MAKKRPDQTSASSGVPAAGVGESDEPSRLAGRNFEEAVEEIEQIVVALESGQLDLSDSLEKYAQGIETLKECHHLLAEAERRITLLSGFEADGSPIERPFDNESIEA